MSNECRRLKSIGQTAKDLHALAEIPITKKQLHKINELLGELVNSGAVPDTLSEKLHETKKLLVSRFLVTMGITDPLCRTLHAAFQCQFNSTPNSDPARYHLILHISIPFTVLRCKLSDTVAWHILSCMTTYSWVLARSGVGEYAYNSKKTNSLSVRVI